MRVKHLAGLAVLALGILVYTSYRQTHHLSYTLHREKVASSSGLGRSVDWHAVWTAAKASANEREFVSAISLVDAGKATLSGQRSCPPQRDCPACPALPHAAAAAGVTAGTTTAGGSGATQQQQQEVAASPAVNASAVVPGGGSSSSKSAAGGGSSGSEWMRFVVDGQAPPISKPLALSVARDNAVIVTWANYALWDFVKTWVYHAREVGLRNFLVGAMDAQIGREMVAAGVPCFAMFQSGSNHSGVGSDHLQWGGEAFHKMGRQKITLAQLFLGLGLDLLLVDADVILLGDVMEYFGRYPQADILVTSDQLASTLEPGDEGLELPDRAQSPMNIGLMYFRYSERTVGFVDSWLAAINADPQYWDQNAFNDLARKGWDPVTKVHPQQKRVFLGANGTLAVGVLPVAAFSGGHTFYVQRLYEVQRVKPYAVHCTFQYGANAGKRNRLREAMLFHDPPEYYTGDSYVSVELRRVPSATWSQHSARNNTAMKRYHFRGLDMQLEAVWPAIRVAAVTNRSLIVPPLACYCDKYWTELEQCRVPGAFQTRIPFLCPMDHVLDPIFMNDPASEYQVRWREHSFLANPRCPNWVKRSWVTFYSSASVSKPVEKWVVQEGGLVVLLPVNLTEGAIREMLAPYSAYKIWHLKNAESFFGGFDNKKLGEEVQKRIEHLRPIMPPDPAPPPPPASNVTTPAGNTTATDKATDTSNQQQQQQQQSAGGTEKDTSSGMLTAVHERR
ncbi:hypothetical protein Agub_g11989 [Astrephomene gubernaculifera]|uniref:Glycosyltransferase n=1 Tax=Astrephomene gubernaculifera TaxID=47775 RepID=A0AAD3DXJ0_9CHLO|nr:hypothetical protein Agub_g11989 [Astrephomene gubernaculifera]